MPDCSPLDSMQSFDDTNKLFRRSLSTQTPSDKDSLLSDKSFLSSGRPSDSVTLDWESDNKIEKWKKIMSDLDPKKREGLINTLLIQATEDIIPFII